LIAGYLFIYRRPAGPLRASRWSRPTLEETGSASERLSRCSRCARTSRDALGIAAASDVADVNTAGAAAVRVGTALVATRRVAHAETQVPAHRKQDRPRLGPFRQDHTGVNLVIGGRLESGGTVGAGGYPCRTGVGLAG
jgi:hypothetical protein